MLMVIYRLISLALTIQPPFCLTRLYHAIALRQYNQSLIVQAGEHIRHR